MIGIYILLVAIAIDIAAVTVPNTQWYARLKARLNTKKSEQRTD